MSFKKEVGNKDKSTRDFIGLRYSLYALIIGIPLLYSQLSFDRFDLPKMSFMRVVVLLALTIWLYQSIKQKRISFVWSKPDILLLLFFCLAVISSIFSVSGWVSLLGHYKRYEGLFTFLNYAIIYLLAVQVFSDKRSLNELSLVILTVASVLSAYGILQFFGFDPLIGMLSKKFEAKRIFSTLGNPIFLGGYLAMILPISLAAFINANERKYYLIYGVGSVLVGTAILLTFSRGAWLAALIGLFYLAYQLRYLLRFYLRHLLIIAAVFFVIFISFFLSTSDSSSSVNLGSRIKSVGQLTTGSMATRIETWKSAAKIIQSRPLLGYGPDTFRYVFQRYETLAYAKEGAGKNLTDNAHSYPLHLTAGVGLPAAIIFFIFIIWRFNISVRSEPADVADASVIYQGFKAGLLAYAVYLLAGISVIGGTVTFAIVFGALAGASSAGINYKTELSGRNRQVFMALSVIVLIIALLAAVLGMMMLAADTIALSARNQAKQAVNETVAAKIRLASRLYPGNGIYLSDLGYYYRQYPFGDKKALMDQAAQAFKAAAATDPLVSEYHEAFGRIYLDQVKTEVSIAAFKQALELRPLYVAARYWLGVAYYQQGRFKLAVKSLLTIQEVAPGYANSYGGLADSYNALGNKTKARYYADLAKSQEKHK